jgi:hypothetical protein
MRDVARHPRRIAALKPVPAERVGAVRVRFRHRAPAANPEGSATGDAQHQHNTQDTRPSQTFITTIASLLRKHARGHPQSPTTTLHVFRDRTPLRAGASVTASGP